MASTQEVIEKFNKIVWDYYFKNKRDFPWRRTRNPYRIFVSEVMLQQTQTGKRTVDKYMQFITLFPDFESLATASVGKVLKAWQGLGYNKRALNLRKAAQVIIENYQGKLPDDPVLLDQLPGIGEATSNSIAAFGFNKPVVFIETNIRTVFIHHFFKNRTNVRDEEILPLVEKTLNTKNAREWYSALMDYGVHLKKEYPNPGRKSAHHQKQSKFEGSNRQVRGLILKTLIKERLTDQELAQKIDKPISRVRKNLKDLAEEGFIKKKGKRFSVL